MIRARLARGASLALFLGFVQPAPARASDPPAGPLPEIGRSSHVMAMCPMNVPGAQVQAADVEGGESLTFTTDGPVEELRRRVEAMARRHDERYADTGARARPTGGGMMGSGNAMNGMTVPASRSTVVEVEGGASIVVVPEDAADLEPLRAAIRASADRLRTNGCDMMGQTGT